MKAVLKETKRIMAVLLSVAMIFAYVPNNIYAAETTSGNDTEEAVTDGVEQATEPSTEQKEEPSTEAPSEEQEESVAQEAVNGAEGGESEESPEREALNDDGTPTIVTEGGHQLYLYKGTDTAKSARQNSSAVWRVDNNNIFIHDAEYGTDVPDTTYTVKAEYTSGDDKTYSDLSWKIVEAPDTVANHTAVIGLTESTVSAYPEVTSFPDGFSISASGATVTITGTPMEATPYTAYFAVGTDTESDSEIASKHKIVVPVEFTVTAPDVTGVAADANDGGTPINKIGGTLTFNNAGAPVKMGYTVLDTDPTGAGTGTIPENVKPVEITIVGSTIRKTTPMEVSVSLEGDDAEYFADPVVTGTALNSGKRLDKSTPIKIKVAPKTGLPYKAGGYEAYLVLTSKGFYDSATDEHEAVITLSFLVGSNLEFTAKQGEDEADTEVYVEYPTEATDHLDGLTVYKESAGVYTKVDTSGSTLANDPPYYVKALYVGEVEVGETLDSDSQITINATGGSGKLEFDDFDDTKLPKGMTASKTEGTKNSTLTLGGTIDPKAYTWSASTVNGQAYDNIAASVTDKGSKATLASDEDPLLGGYEIVVQPADVTYASEIGESLEEMTASTPATGVDDYAYSWATDTASAAGEDVYTLVTPPSGQQPVGANWYTRTGDSEPYTYTAATGDAYQAGNVATGGDVTGFPYKSTDGTTIVARPQSEEQAVGGTTYYTYNGPFYAKTPGVAGQVAAGQSVGRIKVTNNSNVPLTFKPKVYTTTAESAPSTDFTVINQSIPVAAGQSGYIDVCNTNAMNGGDPAITGILSITGDGITKTQIEISAVAIDKDTPTITTKTLKDAEVGVSYETTLTSAGGAEGKWSIVGVANGDGSATTTEGYLLNTYGLVLDKNTGVLYGTPKKSNTTGIKIKVARGTTESGELTLKINKSTKGISLKSNGAEISSTKKLKLSDIAGDDEDGTEAAITITNNTTVDFGDLTATITNVTGPKSKTSATAIDESGANDIYEYFRLATVDEDGDEVESQYGNASVRLLKSKNYALKLVSTAPMNDAGYNVSTNDDPSQLTPIAAADDPYTVTVKISGTDIDDQTFVATLRVNSTLTIAEGTAVPAGFTVGTKVEETTTEKWTTSYWDDGTNADRGDYTFVAVKDKLVKGTSTPSVHGSTKLNPNTDEVTFKWAKAEGATLDIKDSGLTLSSKGVIGGTPVKAGIYKVLVTATGYGDTYNGLIGSKEFELEVLGSSTVAVNAVVGSNTATLVGDEVLVLQGAAVNDTIDSNSGVQINVTATTKAVTKPITIKVEDVDTRSAVDKKIEKDVHEGSTNYIGTSATSIASIAKDGSASFRVVPKSTAKAGDYLVKVTLSGDEVSTTYFFVEYIVSEKLAVSTAGQTLKTGFGDDYRMMLTATGAENAAKIDWSEVQQKATADVKRADGTTLITKGEFPKLITNVEGDTNPDNPNEKITSAVTAAGNAGIIGLALAADRTNPSSVTDIDLEVSSTRAWIGGTAGRSKAPATEKGSFNVKVQAKTNYSDGSNYNNIDPAYEFEKNAADSGYIERTLHGKNGTQITNTNYYLVGNGLGTLSASGNSENGAKATFGEQTATAAFVLTVGDTEKVKITDVTTNDAAVIVPTYCPSGKASEAAATIANDAKNETKNATEAMKDFTRRAPGTYKSDGITYVTVKGYTFKEAPVKSTPETLTLTISNGSKSQITANVKLKSTDSKFDLTGGPTVTIPATSSDSTIVIKPKSDTLKTIGTYSDTIVITGNNMETIEFPVSVKVAAVTREVAVYQRGEKNSTISYDPEKDTEVVDKTTTVKGAVAFKPVAEDGTPTEEAVLFINNAGNSAIASSIIEVKDANGTGYTSASEKRKLYFNTSSGTTNQAAVTGNWSAGGWTVLYVKLTPDAAATAGVQTAYLKVSYDDDKEVVIPVNYTVYATGLDLGVDVTPTKSEIEILKGATTETDLKKKCYAEGTNFTTVAPEFVITNKNTGDASKGLYEVTATLTGSDKSNFEFVYADATKLNAAKDELDLGTIAVNGGTGSFKVIPKSTIRKGDHEVEVTISSPSLSTNIKKTVKITVIPGTVFTEKVSSTSDTALLNDSYDAYRLYRGLVVSGKVADSAITVNSNTSVDVRLDSGNIIVKFTLSTPLGANTVDGARAYKKATGITATVAKKAAEVGRTSFNVSLNETEKSQVSTTLGDEGSGNDNDITYFDDMTFNLFSTVLFELDGDAGTAYFTKDVLDYKTNENITLYSNAAATTAITVDETTDYKTVRSLRVVLPNNTALKDTIGTKFPAATKAGRAFEAWSFNGDTFDANTIIKSDINTAAPTTVALTPTWHSHKYTTNTTSAPENHAKWTWTKLPSGDYTASLTLHCTETNCPDYAGSEVILTDVSTPNVAIEKNVVEASCEHGRSVKYSAKVEYPEGSNVEFTSEYFDETGEDQPLGHDWNAPVITWAATGSGEGGAYTKADVTVKRTCKVDPTHVANLTVTAVNASVTKAATCLEDGETTFTVVYTDVDKFGKPSTSVTDTTTPKTVVIKALGHDYKLIVEWNDDHESVKTAKLVCSRCAAGTEGHEVNMPATDVTYNRVPAAGNITSNQAKVTYEGKNYESDVWYSHTDHNWSIESFDWSSYDFSAKSGDVVATFKCSGGETDTATASVAQENRAHTAKKGDEEDTSYVITKFTATATMGNGKGEDVKYKRYNEGSSSPIDATEADWKALEEEGEETGEITVEWAESNVWRYAEVDGEWAPVVGEANYTGSPIKPLVVCKNGSKVLKEGVDYKVSYANNTKVVNKTAPAVKITGLGNYETVKEMTFKIVAADISWATAGAPNYDSTKRPAPVLTYYGNVLKEGAKKDYTLDPTIITVKDGKGSDGSDYEYYGDGTYVKVTGVNNFTEKALVPVKAVAKTELKGIAVKVTDVKNITYNGKYQTLSSNQLIVTDKKTKAVLKQVQYFDSEGKEVTDQSDIEDGNYETIKYNYHTSYKNNVNAGKATVVVIGAGDYTGSVSKTFTIKANTSAKIKAQFKLDDDEKEITSYSFKSTGVTPAVTVTAEKFLDQDYDGELDDVVLQEGVDYKVTYKNNKKVGTGTATISFLGNFKGTKDASTKKDPVKTFTITAVKLADEDVNVKVTTGKQAAIASGKKFSTITKQIPAFLTVDGVQVATKEYNTTYHAAKVVDPSDENAVEVELKGESAYIVPGDVIDKNATFSEATYIFVKATPKTNTTYDATGADSKLVALTRIVPLASDAQYNVTKLTAKAVLTANATGKNHKSIGYTGKAIFFDKASFGDVENDDDAKAAYAKRQADISLTYKKASIDVDKYFDVQYVNNIQQGTATVILSPKTVITEGDDEKANPYTGTRTFTFKIKKSAIQDTMKPAEEDK